MCSVCRRYWWNSCERSHRSAVVDNRVGNCVLSHPALSWANRNSHARAYSKVGIFSSPAAGINASRPRSRSRRSRVTQLLTRLPLTHRTPPTRSVQQHPSLVPLSQTRHPWRKKNQNDITTQPLTWIRPANNRARRGGVGGGIFVRSFVRRHQLFFPIFLLIDSIRNWCLLSVAPTWRARSSRPVPVCIPRPYWMQDPLSCRRPPL